MKPVIEEIIGFDYPFLILRWSNSSEIAWNVKAYLEEIIKDTNSDYWKILQQDNFQDAYVEDGLVKWANIVSQMYCGGDSGLQAVSFSTDEIAKDLRLV